MTEENRPGNAEEAQPAGTEAPPSPEAVDIEALQKAVAELKEKADTNLAGWQRAQADFINHKRRCEQEKVDAVKSATVSALFNMLPVLDDLEMALANIPPEAEGQKWLEGIRLIARKWKACQEVLGVAPIKAVGEPFDPRFHEAVKQDSGKEGIIIAELQKGYMLGDKVIRPSRVIVGTGEPAPEAGAASGQAQSKEEN